MIESLLPKLFWIVFGGGFLQGGISAEIQVIKRYRRLRGYQSGFCTIQYKAVHEIYGTMSTLSSSGTSFNTVRTTSYVPKFEYVVYTPDGKEYQAQGYSAGISGYAFQKTAQRIIDQYTVGWVYPCWYHPSNPTEAVLTQHFSMWIFLFPILFIGIGGITLLIAIQNLWNN